LSISFRRLINKDDLPLPIFPIHEVNAPSLIYKLIFFKHGTKISFSSSGFLLSSFSFISLDSLSLFSFFFFYYGQYPL